MENLCALFRFPGGDAALPRFQTGSRGRGMPTVHRPNHRSIAASPAGRPDIGFVTNVTAVFAAPAGRIPPYPWTVLTPAAGRCLPTPREVDPIIPTPHPNEILKPRWISLVWGVGMKGLPGNGVGRYPAAASRKRAQGVGRYPRSGDVSDRYMTVTRPLWAAC